MLVASAAVKFAYIVSLVCDINYFTLRPFVMRDFFFEVANRLFCCQVSFCPVKRGNQAGFSRNESDYSRRGTQTSFPLLESRSCEKFGVAHFSIV